MSQVLANPEINDPPENNDPPKVETSNPEQIKCHTDLRFININDYLTFLFITLKVEDIHDLFSKFIPFTLVAISFFEVPMWSTRFSHPKLTTPRK